jgi:membrane-associated protein
MPQIFDIMYLIQLTGLVGILIIVFAESGGVIFGFFLPGDSLLFTAGFVASRGLLSFWHLLIGSILVAIIAGYVGYWFGHIVGHKLFEKKDSLFFRKKHLEDTKKFFEKHGNKTIILSRFVPVIRTFAPIFAGIGEMDMRRFSIWNIVGGIIWPAIMVISGFYLGRYIPGAEKYFLIIVLLIIISSVVPVIFEWFKNRKKTS